MNKKNIKKEIEELEIIRSKYKWPAKKWMSANAKIAARKKMLLPNYRERQVKASRARFVDN